MTNILDFDQGVSKSHVFGVLLLCTEVFVLCNWLEFKVELISLKKAHRIDFPNYASGLEAMTTP